MLTVYTLTTGLGRRSLLTGLAAAIAVACSKQAVPAAGGIRIASLAPSLTEAVFALGAGAQLVGRSRFCDYPSGAAALQVVAEFGEPNWEALLATKPTIVVGTTSPSATATAARLSALGIQSYFAPSDNVAQTQSMLRELGARLDCGPAAATLLNQIDADFAAVRAAAAVRNTERLPRIRVALAFGLEPLVLAGPASYATELLTMAGFVNVASEGAPYTKMPLEKLLALNPDVLVECAMGEARGLAALRARAGIARLPAVVAGRVASIDDTAVMRPGPRIGAAAKVFAAAIVEAYAKSPPSGASAKPL
jgi:iron complex transport system substrate-binding protein